MGQRKSIYRVLLIGLAFASCFTVLPNAVPAADLKDDAAALAGQILDDRRPESERKKIIASHPELSLELLRAMVSDMPASDAKEEYRRIPSIWRVTVEAAKRNDLREIKPIVEFTLPRADSPLRDWQAVVMGGGIINGIGLVGAWPDEQIATMVADDPRLRSRWLRMLELASVMADNKDVYNGTRYDALRIIGLDRWELRGPQLCRYLKKGQGIDDELVQGAIGGLGTMRSPQVAAAILAEYPRYNEENRGFALEALLKDSQRMSALLDAIDAGTVKPSDLSPARISKLTNAADPVVSSRARKLFAANPKKGRQPGSQNR